MKRKTPRVEDLVRPSDIFGPPSKTKTLTLTNDRNKNKRMVRDTPRPQHGLKGKAFVNKAKLTREERKGSHQGVWRVFGQMEEGSNHITANQAKVDGFVDSQKRDRRNAR